ncbi:MAG: inosine/xanthosine triphosphatase [Bacteroidota bacterium]|nr:inosine/xanthosine triphosphatase [Bacteroidota bacterium]
MTIKIITASENPVKKEATQAGFQLMFPGQKIEIKAVGTSSGVSDQPMSDAETRTGSENRAKAALQAHPAADFFVGIEGGIEKLGKSLLAFAWITIIGNNKSGQSRTATFSLPPEIAQLVKQGMELGDADDLVFKKNNSKQQTGAVGLLTSDAITRADYYSHAVALALVPFKNDLLYAG